MLIVDLDLREPKLRGLSLVRRISSHDQRTRIPVFCMNDDPAAVTSALEAGASGYLLKNSPSEELVKAVEQLRTGMSYLSHRLGTFADRLQLVNFPGRNGDQSPLCLGPDAGSSSVSSIAFPADEPRDLSRLSGRLPLCDIVWRSPALRAAQTAESLALDARAGGSPVQKAQKMIPIVAALSGCIPPCPMV